jgi:broad specificity phosphatase PhoE
MRNLILIKHARPLVQEDVPPHDWRLSPEGREACKPLADAVRAHAPAVVVTSDEPKAIETGEIIAGALGVPVKTAGGLHEHDRSNVPMMQSREFISAMANFFKARTRRVLGLESAAEASARFQSAVESVLSEYLNENVAIVTHGTVLALFAEDHGAGDGFLLWRRMGLPSLMVFSLPGFESVETIERIGLK